MSVNPNNDETNEEPIQSPVAVVAGEILTGIKGTEWKVEKLLGAGAYGAVVEASNMTTGAIAAIKLEDVTQEVRTLRQEVSVLEELGKINARHCCKVFDRGRKEDRYNWVAMTLVGASFDSLYHKLKGFTIRTSVHLAIGSLEGLQEVHRTGFVHRDVKPANFAIGRSPNESDVIILDFGMARKFLKEGGQHRRARDVAGFRGTVYYSSPVALLMGEQSRRDDIWSWFFMTIELTTGSLPWKNEDIGENDDAVAALARMGNERQQILQGDGRELLKKCPGEYKLIFPMIKQLNFPDRPPYKEMIKTIFSIYVNRGISPTSPLDYEDKTDHKDAARNEKVRRGVKEKEKKERAPKKKKK